ncbi:MAG: hypothetical protein ACXVAJ_00400 [Parachlamydiaceae bacterium]
MTIEATDVSDKTTIFLNNRTAWTCKYKDLFDAPNGWRLGDRIHITYVHFKGYYLQNASYQGCVPVKLQNANSHDLTVNTIQEIIKNDKKSTNTIVLNDGTRWFIGFWSSAWMKNWQAGDRIIVTEQEFIFGSNADHFLLNLDQGEIDFPENVIAQLLYSPEVAKFEDFNKRANRDWKFSIVDTWQENNSFIIELNNKTLWRCSQPKLDWQVGDNLKFEIDHKEYRLINLRNSKKINGTIINSHSEEIDLPTIQKISKSGKRMDLSDGSVWFSRIDKYKKWQKGNRIIVSPLNRVGFDTSTHTLINIDKSTEDKDNPNYSSATLVK